MFVERDPINERIVDALRTPGKQIVVYGHSGSGKTTLVVNKLHQLYESHITSRCVRNLSFEALVATYLEARADFSRRSKEVSSSTTQRRESIVSAIRYSGCLR